MLLLRDDFLEACGEGEALLQSASDGQHRLGVDSEAVLSVDNSSLRMPPLVEPGFGRAALAYGPFEARPGLAMAVLMTNGHNTSQLEPLSDTFWYRVRRWFVGSGVDSGLVRVWHWLRAGQLKRTIRQFRWWWRLSGTARKGAADDDNLAVGWFDEPAVTDPRREGCAFIMHALGPENGQLEVGCCGKFVPSIRGVQNVPIHYVVIHRQGSVLYLAASLPSTNGLPALPAFRAVGVAEAPQRGRTYAGVQQAMLGQVGFRADTRVHGVRVAQLESWSSWYAGAHAAAGPRRQHLHDLPEALVGGPWHFVAADDMPVTGGSTTRSPRLAYLDPGAASGLVRVQIRTAELRRRGFRVALRCSGPASFVEINLTANHIGLARVSPGERFEVESRPWAVPNKELVEVLVLDDGRELLLSVEFSTFLRSGLRDDASCDATKIGLMLEGDRDDGSVLHLIEAHPRTVRLPEVLNVGTPSFAMGSEMVIADDFVGIPADLEGRETPIGDRRWTKRIGTGVLELTGHGALRVRADPLRPCPDRTAYLVDWASADLADLEITVTPPGTRTGERHQTTAGLILYQDALNYLTVNAYRADYYPGGSVSSFFRFRGFEDVYDAIWTNVADRIDFGKAARIRLCCDGETYVVMVNGETVLHRAFSDVYPTFRRLRIRKVGVLANWEFGTDTGSRFEGFIARR